MKLPSVSIRREYVYHTLLLVCAGFAIGAIGFFLAVFLEYNAHASTQTIQQIKVIQEQKDALLRGQPLSESTSSVTITSTSSPPQVLPGQASSGDTGAAAKLRVLESLNQ